MSEGHHDAWDYPLFVLWEEAKIASDRINGVIVTEAVLLQQAVHSLMDKKAGTTFSKHIKRLTR